MARHRRRFIPACAGNIASPPWPDCCCSVHPRVCGEHSIEFELALVDDGSSPRVRGTCGSDHSVSVGHRFIPACAGNMRHPSSPTAPLAVHPRVCGEHAVFANWPKSLNGSSPRVRGTLSIAVWYHVE